MPVQWDPYAAVDSDDEQPALFETQSSGRAPVVGRASEAKEDDGPPAKRSKDESSPAVEANPEATSSTTVVKATALDTPAPVISASRIACTQADLLGGLAS